MRKLVFIFFLLAYQLSAQTIEEYRKNYMLATTDKDVCEAMIKQLTNHKNQPLHIAYLGAYQSIWANHVINPISKLSTFKKGKTNLENAISQDNNNIEIRFLRYSIQKNVPKFLNYYQALQADRIYILKNKNLVVDNSLKELIKHVN